MTERRNDYIDQWRGVSVTMVVIHHFVLYRLGGAIHFEKDASLASKVLAKLAWCANLWAVHGGMVGVSVFFVVSGYLITSIMLREEERTGTVSLRAFYWRRTFRIFPAMLVYIAAVTSLSLAGVLRSPIEDALPALSFACNTSWVNCEGPFNQFWSLAAEEQFYLVWPLLVTLTKGRTRVALVAVVLALATIASPIHSLRIHGWLSNGLAIACLSAGALYAMSGQFRAVFFGTRTIPSSALLLFVGLFVPFAMTRWGDLLPITLRLLPFLLIATVLGRSGSITRSALLSRALHSIGLVSYSLYLWHALATLPPSVWATSTFTWLSWLAIPAAWLSYRYLEVPMIATGRRMAESRRRRAAITA